MDLERAIQIALDGEAIMLTGAGFSYGAKNIIKKSGSKEFENIPLGNELKNRLLSVIGEGTSDASLEDVSEYFIKTKGKSELIRILTECFTVSEVEEYHKRIMSIEWRRVYTTNYDRVAEFSAKCVGKKYKSISLNDSFNEHKDKICLHINGDIDTLDEKTLNSSFKLTNRSYSSENLVDKPWFDYMSRNFQSAKVIFIVGFSMSFDLDIKRIISSVADRKTIVFITAPNADAFEMSRLNDYGDVYRIGVRGLADKIDEISKKHVKKVIDKDNYTSFEHYTNREVVLRDNTSLTDIICFYSQGKMKDSLLKKNSQGQGKYIVFRKQLELVKDKWRNVRTFIVTSYIGNGKTVFCYELIEELRERNIDVFFLVKESVDVSDDVENICSLDKKCIVIIDDFYKHYETLKMFNDYGCENVTFVLTGRITKEESNIKKIKKQLNLELSDICTISLNKMSEEECDCLATVMSNEHFVPRDLEGLNIQDISLYLQNDCKSRMADIVLYLYESSTVKNELRKLYRLAIDKNIELRELTIVSICNTVMSLGLSKFDIGAMCGIDFVAARASASEIFDEIFEPGDKTFELRSSIIAREILYHIIDNQDAIKMLKKIAEYANMQREYHTRFNEVLKALVSHYNFATDKYSFSKSHVKNFYEEIRNLDFYRENPFFWEQFALTCMDIYDFKTARQCVSNAYAEGKKIMGFVPFQICTIDAELIISEQTYKLSSLDDISSELMLETSNYIREAKDKLLKHYEHEDNNKGYVFSIAGQIPKLYDLAKKRFTRREHSIYIEDMIELRGKLEVYAASEEGKMNDHFAAIKAVIDESLSIAKAYLRS